MAATRGNGQSEVQDRENTPGNPVLVPAQGGLELSIRVELTPQHPALPELWELLDEHRGAPSVLNPKYLATFHF